MQSLALTVDGLWKLGWFFAATVSQHPCGEVREEFPAGCSAFLQPSTIAHRHSGHELVTLTFLSHSFLIRVMRAPQSLLIQPSLSCGEG